MIQDHDPGDEDPSMDLTRRVAAYRALCAKYPWASFVYDVAAFWFVRAAAKAAALPKAQP